jgi:hypothetical protein
MCCDFEHNIPYEADGRTCLCNGNPKCCFDHRLKQDPRWKAEQLPNGNVRWWPCTDLSAQLDSPTEPTGSGTRSRRHQQLVRQPAFLAVFRYRLRLGHLSALGEVSGDAGQEGASRQEERSPVRKEGVPGVARVPDEKDRERERQHGDDHVAHESRGMHGPVVDNTPFDLGQRREPVRDGDGMPVISISVVKTVAPPEPM